MKQCNNCGTLNRDDAAFCKACGKSLSDGSIVETGETQTAEISGKTIAIVALTFIVILLVGFILYGSSIGPPSRQAAPVDTEYSASSDSSYSGSSDSSYSGSSSSSSYSNSSSSDYSDNTDYSYSSDEKTYEDSDDYQVISAYTMPNDWYFYDQTMLDIYSATASSTLPNEGVYNYSPENVLDNDSKTTWSENLSGIGKGESITLTNKSGSSKTVNHIYFLNGYTKDQHTFDINTTPTELNLYTTQDGSKSQIAKLNLMNSPTPQQVDLEKPITLENGESITFEITDAVSGPNDTHYDTCISEIRLG